MLFNWMGEIKSSTGLQLWELGLAVEQELPSNVLQGHHIFMLDLSETKTEDRGKHSSPKAGHASKALISPFLGLGLFMGTGACCLCLLGYKALKWAVPALCSGWPQNSPDLLIATGRWQRFFWERPRPRFQPHSRCHKHRKDIWDNLAKQWSLGLGALLCGQIHTQD